MPTQDTRNFSSVSPSARVLLLLKGHTTISYARQAAELIQYPEPFAPDFSNRQPGFWIRVMHFEARYWSINQLLADLLPAADAGTTSPSPTPAADAGQATNILELSSGFSFRGLALAADYPVHYIDSDLPEVIATKQQLVTALVSGQLTEPQASPPLRGQYELRPLNALDIPAFQAIVESLEPGPLRTSGNVPRHGPLIIVNEGLLMYLGKEEKQQLVRFIGKTLKERGGYWITADIYLRRGMLDDPDLAQGDTLKQFFEQHKVKENMFETFDEAAQLFSEAGLVLDKEAEPDYANLSALPHFLASASPALLQRLQQVGKIHATWRLRPAP